jgi:uncharacterized membrane protein YcaP (DUF421 family)
MATIFNAIVGYFVLLLVVRVLKRRAGSQMTMFEFVLVFLIGGVVILATVGKDRSVVNCTCAVIVVGMIHRLLALAKSKNPRVGALIDGSPLVVMKKGEWQAEVVRGMKIRREDVEAAAREQGMRSLNEVSYAILERNGSISVLSKD